MARYRPNHRSMAQLLLSRQLRRPVMAVTREIARRASESAPRRTGDLASSYTVRSGVSDVARWEGGLRVVGYVENSDPAALAIEFGTSRQKAQHTLRNAGRRFHNPKAKEATRG